MIRWCKSAMRCVLPIPAGRSTEFDACFRLAHFANALDDVGQHTLALDKDFFEQLRLGAAGCEPPDEVVSAMCQSPRSSVHQRRINGNRKPMRPSGSRRR